jgi:hypothetical protein
MEIEKLTDVPFTFGVELKAIGTQVVEQLEDGDLLIEGWGATLDVDREDEAFTDGAFTKGLKKFLSGGAPLCWHHNYDRVIGKIVHAERVPGRGVWVKAIVDRQPETSPLYPYYQAIKKGRANGLSVGGIFKRIMTPNGPRINDVDIMEWSATATPVGSTATFSVVAGKALEFKAGESETIVANEETEVVEPVVEETEAEKEERLRAEGAADAKRAEEEAQERRDAELRELLQKLTESPELQEQIKKLISDDAVQPGSITTDHLSDELRSRFSELNPDQPSLADLAAALDKFEVTLTQVADHIGFSPESESGSERVTEPASVSVR